MKQTCALARDFSETAFRDRPEALAAIACPLLELALCLSYAMKTCAVPCPLKPCVLASTACLVCPVDAMPDAIPAVVVMDDGCTLVATAATMPSVIEDKGRAKARARAWKMLGESRKSASGHRHGYQVAHRRCNQNGKEASDAHAHHLHDSVPLKAAGQATRRRFPAARAGFCYAGKGIWQEPARRLSKAFSPLCANMPAGAGISCRTGFLPFTPSQRSPA